MAEEKETFETALAKQLDPQQIEKLNEELHERSSTRAAELEQRRHELALTAKMVEGLIGEIMSDKSTLTDDEREKKANAAQLYGIVGIIRGLELVFDGITKRQVHRLPDGERGFSRLTAGEMLKDLNTFFDESGGLCDKQHYMFMMMNDIGVALKAFKDQNGVQDDMKYIKIADDNEEEEELPAKDNEAVRESVIKKEKKK